MFPRSYEDHDYSKFVVRLSKLFVTFCYILGFDGTHNR